MWEPFSASARHAVVRAQQIAQMFGSSSIETQHVAFALAEGDDDVGHLLANALDRGAIRERLGVARGAPQTEMVFSADAKRIIEAAFAEARKLNHDFIASAHMALAVLDLDDPPALAEGTDVRVLRAELARVAATRG